MVSGGRVVVGWGRCPRMGVILRLYECFCHARAPTVVSRSILVPGGRYKLAYKTWWAVVVAWNRYRGGGRRREYVSDPVNQLVCWCIEGVWGGGAVVR